MLAKTKKLDRDIYRSLEWEIDSIQRFNDILNDIQSSIVDCVGKKKASKWESTKRIDAIIQRNQNRIDHCQEMQSVFLKAINSLENDNLRQFCEFHYVEGLSLEKTAERMFYSYDSVNRFKSKASGILIEKLSDHLNDRDMFI